MKNMELQGFAEMTSDEAQRVEGGFGLFRLLYTIKRKIRYLLHGNSNSCQPD